MMKLLDMEQPSSAFRSELITHFNNRYHDEERRFPKCGKNAKAESGRLAQQGRVLTEAMTQAMN
jgi:predicted secreted protein